MIIITHIIEAWVAEIYIPFGNQTFRRIKLSYN